MAARTNNPVVLVIEDDPPIRTLLQDLLQESGYEVVPAHDGSNALQTMSTLKVDLITLDLDLPGITGGEFIKLAHERSPEHMPPIIIITSGAPIPRALRAKVQAVVDKPFDVDDLLDIIRKLVPARKGARRQRSTKLDT